MDRDTKEPVTTKTLFQAASISKPVSGYGVLKTVELGKINLTDDVNTWLITTAEDLAKFAIDIQQTLKGEGAKVISKGMAEKMLTTVNDGMGLSMGVDDVDGNLYFEHSGLNEGFSSQMFASRNGGYGIVVMINANKPAFITKVLHTAWKTYSWGGIPPTY